MPSSTPGKLAYQKKYNAQPEMVRRREANNLARAHAIKAGMVKVGDHKDVDHVVPLDNGGSKRDANTRVTTEHVNRSWRKGSASYNPGKQVK